MISNDMLHKSDSWTMDLIDGRLIATAGADAIFEIDELNEDERVRFFKAYQAGDIAILEDDAGFASVISKLIQAGVFYRQILRAGKDVRVRLMWSAGVNQDVLLALEFANKNSGVIFVEEEADIVVVIRGSGELMPISNLTKDISTPYLFVDTAFDHTISVGPFVVPGETACMTCFAGRLTRAWGDITPPSNPRMGNRALLCAAIILEAIENFREKGVCPAYIERVWSLDVTSMKTTSEKLFKLPWCTTCGSETSGFGEGSFELPWQVK